MNEDELDDWLPIAETADKVNISERTLRRYLKAHADEPETVAGTTARTMVTKTGKRSATVISPAFTKTLKAHFQEQSSTGTNDGVEYRQNDSETAAGTPAPESVPPLQRSTGEQAEPMLDAASEMRLAVVYERLIKSKDDQIESLTARVEALESALQREQENTARAQTLQAMKPQVLAAPQQSAQRSPQPAPAVTTALTPPTTKPRQAKGLRGWLLEFLTR